MRSIVLKTVGIITICSLYLNSGRVYGQLNEVKSEVKKNFAYQIIDTSAYVPYEYPNAADLNLMIAASKGYSSEIKRLIDLGADVNSQNIQGATPLFFAIISSHTETVRELLNYHPTLDKVTVNFETPLLLAVKRQDIEISEALIRAGADIDFPDKHGASPLHFASLYNYLEIVDMLLYYEASVDEKTDEGTTPLLAAIWAGNTDVADLLLQNGANPSISDNDGYTPFLMASMYGDTLMMNLLYKKGADIYAVTKANHNALTLSILNDHREATELLLRMGNKWTTSGKDVVNPYTVAAKYRRKEVLGLLKENNIPGHIKYGLDQGAISAYSRIAVGDYYSGISLSFKEPYLNGGIIAGCDFKLWYTRVQIKNSEHLVYQYFDKGSMVYAGLFKDFALTNYATRYNYSFSTFITAGYTFGNKMKGTLLAPENKFKLIPSAAFKMTKLNLSFSLGMEYIKSEFYHDGPVWVRIGCTYNYFFDKVRLKNKTINWN